MGGEGDGRVNRWLVARQRKEGTHTDKSTEQDSPEMIIEN